MNKKNSYINRIDWCSGVILLVIFAVMLGIFLVFIPKYYDDYIFMRYLRGWYEQQGIWYPTDGGNIFKSGVPWNDIQMTWRQRYEIDNCRLSNVTVVLFELLPKWVGSGLAWLSWCYAMWGMLRLARIRMDQVAMVSVFIFLCMVAMPWRDNMGCLDYQFNYVLPSGMAVWLLLRLTRGGKGFLYHCVTILLSLLVGAWSEAFSVPILAGLIFIAVFYSKSRCAAMWETIAGLCVGIIWLASSPNFGTRVGNEIFIHGLDVKFILKLTVTELPGILLLAVMTLIYAGSKGWKKTAGDRRLSFALISGIVSFGMCCMTLASMRSGWWSALMAVFGVTYILNRLMKQQFRRRRLLSVTIMSAMTGIVWCALIPTDMYVLKTSHEYPRAVRAFLDNPEKEIYIDARSAMSQPVLSHLFDTQSLYWELYSFQDTYYFGGKGGSGNIWKIVPEGLRNFRPEDGVLLEGDMQGILKGDFLVVPFYEKNNVTGYVDIRFGGVEKKDVLVKIIPFRSEADGKMYGYVILWDRMIEYNLLGIDSVSNFKLICRDVWKGTHVCE